MSGPIRQKPWMSASRGAAQRSAGSSAPFGAARLAAMLFAVAVGLAWLPAGERPALGQSMTPLTPVITDVRIDQRLDSQVPLDLEFHDEQGKTVRLGDYFGQKPVVLTLVYYRCPMLCTQVLNSFLKASQGVPLVIGRDYEVVTVSFDDRETPELAAEKKAAYVSKYQRPGAEQGWHFLTGSKESIAALADSVGFYFRYMESSDQYAHASGIMVLTPQGRVSRYLLGIDYIPKDLKFSLIDSANGKIGSAVDKILLLCYHYDPLVGRYGLAIFWLIKGAGMLTLAVIGAFLWINFRREARMPKLTRASG